MLTLPIANPNRSRHDGWRFDALLVLGVLGVVLALKVSTPFFSGLEQRHFEGASTAHDHAPSDRIALIAIDDESNANIGRWPWPREAHAQLIDQLSQAGARTLAQTAIFFEPQTDRGVERLRALHDLLQDPAARASRWSDLGPAARETLLAYITRAEQALDANTALTGSIRRAGRVLLPSQGALWSALVFPAALLLLGHLALVTRRFGVTERRKAQSDAETAETTRMVGLACLGQGQPDLAFDRLRRVPQGEAVISSLQQLALDFDRRRQFNQVQSVYEHTLRLEPGHAEAQQRLCQTRALTKTLTLSPGSAHPGGSLVPTGNGLEQPMLSRYRLEKELGKGVMGVVYQGRDPRIGRVVAIKTLALSAEFEGGDLQHARDRFFREAESAGRLQLPNTVTICDAGEEHGLASIAMELLHGRGLAEHTCAPQLLAPATDSGRYRSTVRTLGSTTMGFQPGGEPDFKL